ncbi:C40 family peptidase [Paenibacillus sp. N5-1-1-5]|uniref:C40 family peptidase n=2 Tax=Paenibacillus radicis (ex Xue et al. 2023) TaxID=2972489 RepID=A0ABT1YT95_9BACL|nr:C40 family peptidase [Paenibacillus radicis (ex Xue et al. 2023)]MCR8636407.1 C40 family peptidase [Paenibacillus radicis (ex Xue et al. 2023)]
MLSGTIATPSNTAYAYSSSKASSVIATGKRYMGVPYKFGATAGQTRNFDCSSFTQYVYGKYGVQLPRTSQAQSHVGTYVSKSNLKPGDLVFFYSPIHHVGIYIGNGNMLHTYGAGGVKISNMNNSFWKSKYKTARRVL